LSTKDTKNTKEGWVMPSWFDLFTVFDWLSPVKAELEDLRRGQLFGGDVSVPERCGVSANEMRGWLDEAGIDNWGWMTVAFKDTILFTVRSDEVAAAKAVLRGHNVPV
jgi:hypothetical protein